MKERHLISYTGALLKNGAVQFNDDWPGVFLTPAFIHELFPEQLVENSHDEVLNLQTTLSYLSHSWINSLVEYAHHYLEQGMKEQTQEIQKVIFTDSVSRVESGPVLIGTQNGYFLRGDNAAYILHLISLKPNRSASERRLQEVLSFCLLC